MSDQPPGQDVLRERLLEIVRRAEMGYTELFEHDAERFYRETGLMAPGKSVPMEMWSDDMDRRSRAGWDEFHAKLRKEFIQTLLDAAAALSGASSPGSGELCGNRFDAGYMDLHCTKPKGHEGQHVATMGPWRTDLPTLGEWPQPSGDSQ